MTFGLLLISFSLLAAPAGSAPGKAIKDDKNACQVMVPADWKVGTLLTGSASDPQNKLSVQVFWERDYTVTPFNEMEIKMRKVEKMFENTAQHIFYQTKGMQFGPTPAATIWTMYTPAAQKGACHCSMTIKAGGSEEAAKSVITTLGPVK